ncbi:MAG: Sporulation related protein [Candidatus Sulfotelmatobacter sp.]|nr:Sporulation related protein [Candidatus Sulfotelmatobacter sp.]
MDSSQDTEITLGTAKLLGLFFGLVMVCAVFFALGYTLGRKSDPGLTSLAATTAPQIAANRTKPAGAATGQPTQPMGFYKAVEQKGGNAQLTAATADAGSGNSTAGQPESSPGGSSNATQAQPSPAANPPDPMAPIPMGGYFVQVAAVSKEEDAESLVDALKKKQYPAFVASNSSTDKLFRIQLGPFGDIKDAEGMRLRLVSDGYNPILKK